MKDIQCEPYAPFLMESTRSIGYSLESAIADIVDNSITARATQIDIIFESGLQPYVYIVDNGCGMDSEMITESMRYGSSSPSMNRDDHDLGRYGLGMKTASLSQCRSLTVISKQNSKINGRCWDLDHIIETKDWNLQMISEEECKSYPGYNQLLKFESGTLVIWQNLDKLSVYTNLKNGALAKAMMEIQDHLELVFHRYLQGEDGYKVKMTINGNQLVPLDPFFREKSKQIMNEEIITIPNRKGNVVVKPYILPHPDKMTKEELDRYGGKAGYRSAQGFYIYRNKRLLTWGTWFRLRKKDEFTKLARVEVDIPNSLDDLWTLDVKKSKAYPPEVVKVRLKELVDSMSNPSKKVWKCRKQKELSSKYSHVWTKYETRTGWKYEVNYDYPILDDLLSRLDPDEKGMLESYLDLVQKNLPIHSIYSDMVEQKKFVPIDENEEQKECLDTIRAILYDKTKAEAEDMISLIKNAEPYNKYVAEIDQLMEEMF